MSLPEPYPELGDLLTLIGEAGHRLSEINASEGAAGNISIYVGWPIELRHRFPLVESVALPQPVPELVGKTFIVTGSGRRLRDIIEDPAANLGALVVNPGGETAQLFTSPRCLFEKVTSEFNSHLAVHHDQVLRTQTNFHAVIHAQPPHITYLSHIPAYQDETYLNRHLLRWQPELIVQLPEGFGVLPFLLPGSTELMQATVKNLYEHRIVVWSKHGVMARSEISAKRASDRIEYAETAARYEYMDLLNHGVAQGLTDEEIRRIANAFNIKQSIF